METSSGEEGVCRVCRAGVEEGVLMHPCLCKGSIREVHEQCLIQWLDKSKKNQCELCGASLMFTKVFAKTMPDHLPILFLTRRFLQACFSVVLLILRAILVATCWLVALPYVTLWILRGFLMTDSALGALVRLLTGIESVGESGGANGAGGVANNISLVQDALSSMAYVARSNEGGIAVGDDIKVLAEKLASGAVTVVNGALGNLSASALEALSKAVNSKDIGGDDAASQVIGNLSAMVSSAKADIFANGEEQPWKRLLSAIAKDVFSGQIIASSVVVVFVVGFLLREWIIMNAPFPLAAPPIVAPAAVVPPPFVFVPPFVPAPEPVVEEEWNSEEEREIPELEDIYSDEYAEEGESDWDARPDEEEAGPSFSLGSHWNEEEEQFEAFDGESPTRIRNRQRRRQNRPGRYSLDEGRSDTRRRAGPTRRPRPRPDPLQYRNPLLDNNPIVEGRINGLPPARLPPPQAAAVQLAIDNNNAVIAHQAAQRDIWGGDADPEEMEAFDDFEGVLEAIGMRGPLTVLVQNMGLMNLLIALCLGVSFWIPLCLGRVLAAINIIRIISLPLRLVRMISDPIFDTIFSFFTSVAHLGYSAIAPLFASFCNTSSPSYLAKICTFVNPLDVLKPVTASAPVEVSIVAPKAISLVIKKLALTVIDHWDQMAYADDITHRALCVALGYASVLIAGACYLKSTNGEYSQTVNRAIHAGIKQQLTLLKVCFVVFIELIVFPLTCGLILNFVTLPLFPGSTVATRMAFHSRAPFSAMFLSWLVGTVFMFLFSISIDAIRACTRPGSLWFIRDPASTDFHPIREILERKLSVQARKIAISALLYAGVIFATFGVSILFLRYACVGVLPLRWSNERNISVPIDLIIARFLLPLIIRFTDPRAILRKAFVDWAKLTAHHLRLTQFMFGTRVPSEEGSHIRSTWPARLLLKRAETTELEEKDDSPTDSRLSQRDVVFRKDGGFGRVPAVDGVHVAPGRRMLVRVTEQGVPLDQEGFTIIAAQALELATTRTQDKYEVVYLPPNFKTRIGLFVYLLWFSGTLSGMAITIGPLLIGREVFSYFTEAPVHDLYSLTIGGFVVGLAALCVRLPLQFQPSYLHPRNIATVLHYIFAIISTFILLPLLSSFFLTLYILLPVSHMFPQVITLASTLGTFDSPNLPTFQLLPMWATGCVLLNVSYYLCITGLAATHPHRENFTSVETSLDAGEYALAVRTYNRNLLRPLLTRLSALVIFPGVLAWGWAIKLMDVEGKPTFEKLLGATYGMSAILLGSYSAVIGGEEWTSRWILKLREEEYLVEKKLRNHEDGPEVEKIVKETDEGAVEDGLRGTDWDLRNEQLGAGIAQDDRLLRYLG